MEESVLFDPEVYPPRRKHRFLRFILIVLFATVCGFVGWYAYGEIRHTMPGQTEQLAPFQDDPVDIGASEEVHYARTTLDASDQELYDIVYDALLTGSKRSFPTDDAAVIERIERNVLADHPELADYVALVTCEGSMFSPAYVAGVPLIDGEQAHQLSDAIEAAVQDCLASVPAEGDDYARAKAIYEWLVLHTAYDEGIAQGSQEIIINAKGYDSYTLEPGSSIPADHGQTLGNVFVQGKAVCAGYARAFQYLLQRIGIPCVYISGQAAGSSHAWDAAYLDGNWYLIDPTWGDPEYSGAFEGEAPPQTVDYRFFCVDGATMGLTHQPDGMVAVPSCTATADNYYVREGLLFSAPDDERFIALLQRCSDEGTMLSIRCADQDTYDGIMDRWIYSGEAGRYTPSGSYRYATDDLGLLTIEVWPL